MEETEAAPRSSREGGEDDLPQRGLPEPAAHPLRA